MVRNETNLSFQEKDKISNFIGEHNTCYLLSYMIKR